MIKEIKRILAIDRKTISMERVLRSIFKRIRHQFYRINWKFQGKKNKIKLESYKNLHKGERCFIIGNGPSLNKMDLTLLKDENTFGMNRINLLFDKMGFKTTYHVIVNSLVVEQFLDEIKEINVPSFVPWKHRSLFKGKNNYSYMLNGFDESFSTDLTKRFGSGSTVTYNCMQLAYYMGFKEIYLIGIDHNFKEKGIGKIVTSQGDDPNHFDPNYFGKGIKWGLANLPQSERAYQYAKEAIENDGRIIKDATIGGKLQIFEKVDYYSLFK